jgi:hypothetical protein
MELVLVKTAVQLVMNALGQGTQIVHNVLQIKKILTVNVYLLVLRNSIETVLVCAFLVIALVMNVVGQEIQPVTIVPTIMNSLILHVFLSVDSKNTEIIRMFVNHVILDATAVLDQLMQNA